MQIGRDVFKGEDLFVFIGHESGGYGNGPNHYKLAVASECPKDEVLYHASSWRETDVIRTWKECSYSFFDTPGRRQLLYQATAAEFKRRGMDTTDLSQRIIAILLENMPDEELKVVRRRIEDRLRKDRNFLLRVAKEFI